jgi:S-adenosylmethionine:tRNA ribosyltransferase-isomerase
MERLSDYMYDLPEELIAQTPLDERSDSRLLVLHRESGMVEHRQFRDVLQVLQPGDLLVLNDTRVSAVRLLGHKETGGAVEALLLREVEPGQFEALLRPGKRLRMGSRLHFESGLAAEVLDSAGGDDPVRLLRFDPRPDLADALNRVGLVPLPPYIQHTLADRERYQTVYSREAGSAAAPTAGLHFTQDLLARLADRGVRTTTVTLDVSIDTFRPVQVENLAEHVMHGETCHISEAAATQINESSGRIIAVGTTTVRTLESMAVGKRQVRPGRTSTKLFIRPGFDFQIVDGMFTNFHFPGTTMMLMISALAGRGAILDAYASAVAQRYRFLSFGDSMLII